MICCLGRRTGDVEDGDAKKKEEEKDEEEGRVRRCWKMLA